MSTPLKELIAQGKEIGLEGEELRQFIQEQQAYEREERLKRRQEAADDWAAQEQKRRFEAEEAEKKRLHDAEQERLRLAQELEMRRLEQRTEQSHVHQDRGVARVRAKTPKLPVFVDGKDDIDAYLERFERYATNLEWEEDAWAINLSALLTGKALEVYSRLSAIEANYYDTVKKALLKRYQLTEDGFRRKFREAEPEVGESPGQFITRLHNYLLRWMKMAGAPETYEGLKQLMVMDQFLQRCPKELAVHLREKHLSEPDHVAATAETFLEAHGMTLASKAGTRRKEKQAHQDHSMDKKDDKECYNCGRKGHIKSECMQRGGGNETRCTNCGLYGHDTQKCKKPRVSRSIKSRSEVSAHCAVEASNAGPIPLETEVHMTAEEEEYMILNWTSNDERVDKILKVVQGRVGNKVVSVLRDSGCSTVCVNKALVKPDQLTGQTKVCRFLAKSKVEAPEALIDIDTPFLKQKGVRALCLDSPVYDLVIGDVEGARCKCDPDPTWRLEEVVGVTTTRAQANHSRRANNPLKVHTSSGDIDVTPEVLKKLQDEDETLDRAKQSAAIEKKDARSRYQIIRGIMYRLYQPCSDGSQEVRQVVVPAKLRNQVMSLAHESLLGGHLGVKKTMDKVTTSFYWPGIHGDISRFCRSCDVCQKTIDKGKVTRVPLERMPLIDEPFKRVAVDIIGKIQPASESGNRYILTLVDVATRYPEAVPLKNISTEAVAEALVSMYSRLGIPQEVLSDQGTQFLSEVMREVNRLLAIKQLVTTPYHPMANGMCEKFNGTLKKIVKRLCEQNPRDWDRYLDAALFAYREAPHESTGFSPFELLYGRSVRGPMQILQELWTKEIKNVEVKSSYQYVIDLREKIEESVKIAHEALAQAQSRYKRYYDKKARVRKMRPGDKVLVLRPTETNKLLMQWKGPYSIEDVRGTNDYRVNINGKLRTYHANLLKQYHPREDSAPRRPNNNVAVCATVIEDKDGVTNINEDKEDLLELSYMKGTETFKDVKVDENLDTTQVQELTLLLEKHQHLFSEAPGETHLTEHQIPLTSDTPVRSRPYPIPYNSRESLKMQLQEMLETGIIAKSDTPYAAPVVIVKKKDGTERICINYRKLNKISIFDPEPTNKAEDIFAEINQAKYLSTIDLSKGYWQIPVAEEDVHKTGFVTTEGTYVFKRMPFGMVNSAATFNRMMRKLLDGLEYVTHYIDDILVYTNTWAEHLEVLDQLFTRIRNANLHVRPSKCTLGAQSVDFLGHRVGLGQIELQEFNVRKIKEADRPKDKKQVRSFLGITGYYRNYIPNYSTIAAPLTDLTKKNAPNTVVWGEPQELAFRSLKNHLTSYPVLRLPDMTKQFVLRTDASDVGIGAVLMQEHDGELFPVSYASRKLLSREKRYSVIERECLALVWAVQKFQLYLYGKSFVLQTDHEPLVYLDRTKFVNPRIMRWSLFLQAYPMSIQAIKGAMNVGADYMSRLD